MSAAERSPFRLVKRFADRELAELPETDSRAHKLKRVSTRWLPTLILSEITGRNLTGARIERTRTDRYMDVRIEECTPISDQEQIGSCEANAWMDAFEMLMPPSKVIQLSRKFSYWTARRTHGAECIDEGTYSVAIAQAAQEIGVCREDLCPYDGRPPDQGGTCNERPSDLAYAEAFSHRLGEVYAVRSYGPRGRDRVITCQRLLDNGFSIPIGCLVGSEWMEVGPSDDVAYNPPTHILGGHEMVIVGYREFSDGTTWFLIRNSWGTGWGRDGHAWMHVDYIADRLATDEVSVPTLPPQF